MLIENAVNSSFGGGGGDDTSIITGVYGAGTGTLTISTELAEEITYHAYTLAIRTFTESTTITVGDNTITRTWTSKAIENAYDENGELVYHCKLSSNGSTLGIYRDMAEEEPIEIGTLPTTETEAVTNE